VAISLVKQFTQKEIDYIIDNRNKKTLVVIAEELHRPYGSILKKCARLRDKGIISMNPTNRYYGRIYSQHEIEYIKNNVGIKSFSDIGKRLRRSSDAIKHKAHRVGAKGISNYYNSKLLSTELGKRSDNIVNWYKQGLLKGKVAKSKAAFGKPLYIFIEEDIVKFLYKYHSLFNNIKNIPNLYFKNVLICAKDGRQLVFSDPTV